MIIQRVLSHVMTYHSLSWHVCNHLREAISRCKTKFQPLSRVSTNGRKGPMECFSLPVSSMKTSDKQVPCMACIAYGHLLRHFPDQFIVTSIILLYI